ncbi:MAG TPA: HlyD family secretion protein [Dongiaceae bacterium]|jgi:membrane fusion protein (multidrug efflux system)
MPDGKASNRIISERIEPTIGANDAVNLDAQRETRQPAPEAEQPRVRQAPPPAPTAAKKPATARPKRRLLRAFLFLLLPIALVIGGYVYVAGGQVMSTDNAYVQANTVGISTDVSGTVIAVDVHDNEVVKKGQVLFRLKQDSFKISLAGAQAQLGTVRNQILTLKATYSQAEAQIAQAQADIPYYQTAFKRQADLRSSTAYNKAAYDLAQQQLTAAQEKVKVAQTAAAAALAQLGNDPNEAVEDNPFYQQAKSAVDDAQRDLNDTVVKAPFDGIVTNVPALQVGQYLKAAQPGFSLVSNEDIWVSASPKETELTYVRPGQPVTVTVDTYPGVEWKGVVGSISPASGSSFSMLPAQNTTGNWVKVVQRIPMIVNLTDLADKPQLRVGMSVIVNVDTGHARGLPTLISRLFDHLGKARG